MDILKVSTGKVCCHNTGTLLDQRRHIQGLRAGRSRWSTMTSPSKWEKAPVPEKLPEPEKGPSVEKEEHADKAVQLKRRSETGDRGAEG